MILFLDDRQSRVDEFLRHYPTATIARTALQAIEQLAANPVWEIVALDHDLNDEDCGQGTGQEWEENNGVTVVRWLQVHRLQIDRIICHSTNGNARMYMRDELTSRGYKALSLPFDDGKWKPIALPKT